MAFSALITIYKFDPKTIMKSWSYVATALAAALVTVTLYHPVSLFIYRIKEPNFICPVPMAYDSIVIRSDQKGSGEFGAKRRNGRSHTGLDIKAVVGTPVSASKSGVAFCGNVPTGYGKYIMIYHPDGYQTFYGHLKAWNVHSAKRVKQKEVIGYVGKTGNAANRYIEPHLHFEIRKEGVPQDPEELIKKEPRRM